MRKMENATLEERIEQAWNDIAHIYAVDADDPKDVERFRSEDWGYQNADFEVDYKEYLELKGEA